MNIEGPAKDFKDDKPRKACAQLSDNINNVIPLPLL